MSNPVSPKKDKQTSELENFLTEPGLKAFLRAYRKHSSDFMEQFIAFLIQAGMDNYIDLFTNQLRISSINNFEYLGLVQDMFELMLSTSGGRKAFIDSGVFNVLIDICYSLANNPDRNSNMGAPEQYMN